MAYYFSKNTKLDFNQTIKAVTVALGQEGFGVLSVIDIQAKIKEKLDTDIPRYTILGACNPTFAFQALQAEPHIGTMLPCNVIVRDTEDGQVEVAAIDPVASMQAVNNPQVHKTAAIIQEKLKRVIATI